MEETYKSVNKQRNLRIKVVCTYFTSFAFMSESSRTCALLAKHPVRYDVSSGSKLLAYGTIVVLGGLRVKLLIVCIPINVSRSLLLVKITTNRRYSGSYT